MEQSDMKQKLLERIDFLNERSLFGNECSLESAERNLLNPASDVSPTTVNLAHSLLVACQSKFDYAVVTASVQGENFVVELSCGLSQVTVRRVMYAHFDKPLSDSVCNVGVFLETEM
jgi:hypothetical protein